MRPIIGITCNYNQGEQQYYLREYYCDSISAAGGLPLILPLARQIEAYTDYFQLCDGLLFSGGGDADPYWFGQAADKDLGEINPQRDEFEIQLARMALALEKPTLGICRGCQILNIAAGGTLLQDIKSTGLHDQKAPRDYPIHDILIAGDSLLADIVQTNRMRVNSFHHQAVDATCNDIVICAYATDGIAEAIESRTSRFYLGVQWHPECMRDQYSRQLFIALVEKSKHF